MLKNTEKLKIERVYQMYEFVKSNQRGNSRTEWMISVTIILGLIVSGISELEGRSMENLYAVAHKEERIENTEKSII